jgi:acetoin utilization protein AcuC
MGLCAKAAWKFAVLYRETLKEYDLGHVLRDDRYENFIDLFKRTLGSHPEFRIVVPPYAAHSDLRLVHTEAYIERIEKCESKDPLDTPLSPAFVRATKLLAGAGELVCSGKCSKAFVVGGGVQHARRDREKGFGVFSDVGICAQNLMNNFGVKRVLILDTDAHFGDGIYDIFADDPSVLYISIHQDPSTLYPGKGFIDEMGEGLGKGYSVCVPLPPRSGYQVYKYVLDQLIIPLTQEFKPELILLVDGSDPHFTDQITHMGLTLEGIKMVGSTVSDMADKICGGKLVDFVGSGYSANLDVVSLGWLASIAGVTGFDVSLEEPIPMSPDLKPETGLGEAEAVVRALQSKLEPYWTCFAS